MDNGGAPQKIIDAFGGSTTVTLNASFHEITEECRKKIDSRFTTKALTVKCIKHAETEVPTSLSQLILPCLRYLDLHFNRKEGTQELNRKEGIQEFNYFEEYKSLNEELWRDNIPRWSLHQILKTFLATDSTGYPDMTIKISIDKFNIFCLSEETLIVAFLDHTTDSNFFSHIKHRNFRNVALLACQKIPDFFDLFETTEKLILHGTKAGNVAAPATLKRRDSIKPDARKLEIRHKDVILIEPEFDEQMVSLIQSLGFKNCYVVGNPDENAPWSEEIKSHVKKEYRSSLTDSSFLLVNNHNLIPQFLSIKDPLQVLQQLVVPIVFDVQPHSDKFSMH